MNAKQYQAERKNPQITPALPIAEISKLYGYTIGHIENLARRGYLHSYKIRAYNNPLIMIHVDSMNAYIRMQENRRNRS